jgi:hypothetical protein
MDLERFINHDVSFILRLQQQAMPLSGGRRKYERFSYITTHG